MKRINVENRINIKAFGNRTEHAFFVPSICRDYSLCQNNKTDKTEDAAKKAEERTIDDGALDPIGTNVGASVDGGSVGGQVTLFVELNGS